MRQIAHVGKPAWLLVLAYNLLGLANRVSGGKHLAFPFVFLQGLAPNVLIMIAQIN